MAVNISAYKTLRRELDERKVTLVAVSKLKPLSDIQTLYDLGQRDFGENYVQELVDKREALPEDIRWHFIGHLQSNKVKFIAPFVHLIHGVDSTKLLKEIDRQGAKNNRIIDVLLQVHIAEEETKFGLDESELANILHGFGAEHPSNVRMVGLMGMASFSERREQVSKEFQTLYSLYSQNKEKENVSPAFHILSMGMSNDYQAAIEEGSTLVRIGSLLFGARG